MSEFLQCTNIAKRFGGITALDGVNLELSEGQTYALIGPNGAGKTTTFNIIAGTLEPTEGSIMFLGDDITGKPEYDINQSGIARTFQSPRPFSTLSIEENILVGQEFGGKKSSRRSVEEILDLVELNRDPTMPPGSLTLFERKKLDLARSIATDPELLLLDELMAGLNASETESIIEIIERLSDNYTIFLIEHIMKAVMELSDHIFVFSDGTKIAEGSPSEIANDPIVLEAYLGEEGGAYAGT